MRNPVEEGIKIRVIPGSNYIGIWWNNITKRYTIDSERGLIELPPEMSEFYDVSLGTKCQTGGCPFCYAGASGKGIYYKTPGETWKRLVEKTWKTTEYSFTKEDLERFFKENPDIPKDIMENLKDFLRAHFLGTLKAPPLKVTTAPFQIAIGSGGEPTEHPEFVDFLRTVRGTGVIPNYTTNGVILAEDSERSEEILGATEKYCSGVAVSFGNPAHLEEAKRAVEKLSGRDIKVVIHHIISTKESVDKFLEYHKDYKGKVHYHVLLPLVRHGRSTEGISEGTYKYLMEALRPRPRETIQDIAFGAKFIKFLSEWNPLGIETFPEQTYSKNMLLKESSEVVLTRSSFDLEPIETLIV